MLAPSRLPRSNKGINLSAPRVRPTQVQEHTTVQSSLWNNLPLPVRSATSSATFRNVSKHVFDMALPPRHLMACWCYGTASSILRLNTDAAAVPLSLATPGIGAIFDWLIDWLIDSFITLCLYKYLNKDDKHITVYRLCVCGLIVDTHLLVISMLVINRWLHVSFAESESAAALSSHYAWALFSRECRCINRRRVQIKLKSSSLGTNRRGANVPLRFQLSF